MTDASDNKATLGDLSTYREQHRKASTAHALGLKESECEVCMLLAEIERLRTENVRLRHKIIALEDGVGE